MKHINPDKLNLIVSKFREHLVSQEVQWKELDLLDDANTLLDFISSNEQFESGNYTVSQIPGTPQFKVFKTKLGADAYTYVGTKAGCLLFIDPPEIKKEIPATPKTTKVKMSATFNPFKV